MGVKLKNTHEKRRSMIFTVLEENLPEFWFVKNFPAASEWANFVDKRRYSGGGWDSAKYIANDPDDSQCPVSKDTYPHRTEITQMQFMQGVYLKEKGLKSVN